MCIILYQNQYIISIAGHQTGNSQVGADARRLEAKFFLSQENLFLLVRPSTDWLRHPHIVEDNLFYLKSTGCRC